MTSSPAPCPLDLGDRIARLAAEATVREHQLIRAIVEFEDSGQWAREGAVSCAQWLSWRIGMGPEASRERVRVAKALVELRLIDAAFSSARLSYSKVRALTRVATPENEAELVEIGQAATASQCERICRTFRKVMAPRDRAAAEAARRVTVRGADDGTVRVSIVLPADEGARFVAGMDSAKALLDRDQPRASDRGDEAARHSRADGLMAMVETWHDAEPRPRRGGAPNEVVLHVTPDALRADHESAEAPAPTDSPCCGRPHVSAETSEADEGAARVSAETNASRNGGCGDGNDVSAETQESYAYVDNQGGVGVSKQTARRLACDASLVPILQGAGGEVLDVGRKRRTVPPAVSRALEARYGRTCAFPGCAHALFLDHHHIEHWADGGETNPDNLLFLCRHHHTFVHEYGWTIEATSEGRTFIAPSGRRVETAPPLGPVDLVALQDHLPIGTRDHALCATGGWEPFDYPEIIHALVEATTRRSSSPTPASDQ